MCSQTDLKDIVLRLHEALKPLFPGQAPEVILFGSYARRKRRMAAT